MFFKLAKPVREKKNQLPEPECLGFYEFFSCSSNIMQLDVELSKNPGECFLGASCDSLDLISKFVKE